MDAKQDQPRNCFYECDTTIEVERSDLKLCLYVFSTAPMMLGISPVK